jgi:hypothetical protein
MSVTISNDAGAASTDAYGLASVTRTDPSATYTATLYPFDRQATLFDPVPDRHLDLHVPVRRAALDRRPAGGLGERHGALLRRGGEPHWPGHNQRDLHAHGEPGRPPHQRDRHGGR